MAERAPTAAPPGASASPRFSNCLLLLRAAHMQIVLESHASLLDLLRRFGSRPPLEELLDVLPALTPRLYSIANSQLESPEKARQAGGVGHAGLKRTGHAMCPRMRSSIPFFIQKKATRCHVSIPGVKAVQATVALSMVEHKSEAGAVHKGVATSWLRALAEPLLEPAGSPPGPAIKLPVHFRGCGGGAGGGGGMHACM